jgi:hypothetical protein
MNGHRQLMGVWSGAVQRFESSGVTVPLLHCTFCEPVQRPADTINYRLAALARPTALFSPQHCPIQNRAKRIGVYGLVQESIRATFGRQLFKLQISIPANHNHRRLSAYLMTLIE